MRVSCGHCTSLGNGITPRGGSNFCQMIAWSPDAVAFSEGGSLPYLTLLEKYMLRNNLILTLIAVSFIASSATACLSEEPPAVKVTVSGNTPPSDAIVLFDGSNLDEWTTADDGSATWIVRDGVMMPEGGPIVTRRSFGDIQFHVEFATAAGPSPEDPKNMGNSGVYIQGVYEIQIINNEQATSIPGWCGGIYSLYPPLVDATKAPGEWQSYDIIFHAPRFDDNGNRTQKGTMTILQNGVLIHDHAILTGVTPGGLADTERPLGPISLQDYGQPVRFRNIWVREI